MDTDQNNGGRNETKAALLGELESIKDLLSEEEMADIPLLDQPLDQTQEAVESVDNTNPEIPLLSNIHLLEEAVDTEQSSPPNNADLSTPAPAKPSIDSPFEELSESIDATLANISMDIDLTDDEHETAPPVEKHLDGQPYYDDNESKKSDLELSESDAFNPSTESEYTSPLEQEIAELEHELEDGPLNDAPLLSAYNPFNSNTDSEAHALEPSENHNKINDEVGDEHSEAESPELNNTTEGFLQEGVLPGQRNLFDDSVADNNHPESQPTQQTDTPEKEKRSRKPQGKPRAKVEQAKGENPFLPKHIRERLHTTKSLMEVIKEAPLDTQAVYHNKFISEHPEAKALEPQALEPAEKNSAIKLSDHDKLDLLINEVIAEFMPKIEAELRARLTNLATSNSGNNQSIAEEPKESLKNSEEQLKENPDQP